MGKIYDQRRGLFRERGFFTVPIKSNSRSTEKDLWFVRAPYKGVNDAFGCVDAAITQNFFECLIPATLMEWLSRKINDHIIRVLDESLNVRGQGYAM
jgi:hypothetical protein